MSLASFIPTLWSNTLLDVLTKIHIYAQPNVANRDYEGEIAQFGDTVKIHGIGPVTIFDVTKNTDIPDPQELTDVEATLVIDQQKGFNFQVDDIEKAQAKPKAFVANAMTNAAYGLSDAVDRYLVQALVDGVPPAYTLGTTGTAETLAAATDAYNFLVALKVIQDQNNVPRNGRWVVVPPWFHGELLLDDRFVHDSTGLSTSALLNGQVGRAAGYDILMSNNTVNEGGIGIQPAVGDYSRVIAGNSRALSFAEQISKTEAFRMEKRFADAVKGLHVYGGKVIYPEVLAQLIVDRRV